MQTLLANIYVPLVALAAGATIGLAFGAIQAAASRRHARLEKEGKFKSGWAATPGSFRRIAYLLVALAVVQFVFPIFFEPNGLGQWCISGGVALGYGVSLYRELRRRMAA